MKKEWNFDYSFPESDSNSTPAKVIDRPRTGSAMPRTTSNLNNRRSLNDRMTDKGRSARVHMCTKELLWDLERSNPMRRAHIMAMAQFFREMCLDGSIYSHGGPLDAPFNYGHPQLIGFYEELESLRNQQSRSLDHIRKDTGVTGESLEPLRIQLRAIEVWMATIGAGISLNGSDDIYQIWAYLIGSQDSFEPAIELIKSSGQRTDRVTGVGDPYKDISVARWYMYCQFCPSQFLERAQRLAWPKSI